MRTVKRQAQRTEKRYTFEEFRAHFLPALVEAERNRAETPEQFGRRLARELMEKFLPKPGVR